MSAQTETIVLATGCFWCTEAIFSELRGIISVVPGYTGGHTPNPHYEDVISGITGHTESIRIEFDPAIIPLADLLDVFWHTHDPTSLDKQGYDIGPQYRSAIFYTTSEQLRIALTSRAQFQSHLPPTETVVTEITPLSQFFPAENHHHNYYQKNSSLPYCQITISPKLQYLRKKYSRLLASPNPLTRNSA